MVYRWFTLLFILLSHNTNIKELGKEEDSAEEEKEKVDSKSDVNESKKSDVVLKDNPEKKISILMQGKPEGITDLES
jgi:hypothetical protein